MSKSTKSRWWSLVLIGGLMPLLLLLGSQFHLSARFLIPLLLVLALSFMYLLIWTRANAHTTGDEWWQDDNCDGWRGY